jgi:hypothetical protein
MIRAKTLLFALLCMGFSSFSLQSFATDNSCDNSFQKQAADSAMLVLNQTVQAIPGVIRVEIESCSEMESPAVTPEMGFTCGVFLWFSSAEAREVFSASSKIWNGAYVVDINGTLVTVPICSRTVSVPR